MNCKDCGKDIAPGEKRNGRQCLPCKYRIDYANRDKTKVRERERRFRQTPKGKLYRLNCNRKRRGMKMAAGKYDGIVVHHQGQDCTYCGSPAECIDHVFPLVHFNDDRESNKVPACLSCNSQKKDLHPLVWLLRVAAQGVP